MIEFIVVGITLSRAVMIFIIMGAIFIRFQWQCGLCGKTTEGNVIQFLLMYCNHDGIR